MPIVLQSETRPLRQEGFGELAYEVMECIFGIHNEMGRFFDEKIYRDEIAYSLPDVETEVPIEVTFDGFSKTYSMDLLVGQSAVFELKTARALEQQHRSQLLNYLFLTGLPHGKLVNLRPERVEHEFVNTTLTREDRTSFCVRDENWTEVGDKGLRLKGLVTAFLRDWGTCLDLCLYEDALTHFLGGEDNVLAEVDVVRGVRRLGSQKVRLAGPTSALRITAIDEAKRRHFRDHARRFLEHTALRSIQWINITRSAVIFATINR